MMSLTQTILDIHRMLDCTTTKTRTGISTTENTSKLFRHLGVSLILLHELQSS